MKPIKQLLPLKGSTEIRDGYNLGSLQSVWNSEGGSLSYNFEKDVITQTPGPLDVGQKGKSCLAIFQDTLPADFYKVSWQYYNWKYTSSNVDPWLCGWCVFDYVNSRNFKYVIVKPNGIEVGHVLGGDKQDFLFTKEFAWDTFSKRIQVDITCYGDSVDVAVKIGLVRLLTEYGIQLKADESGRPAKVKVGIYTEDCVVDWLKIATREN